MISALLTLVIYALVLGLVVWLVIYLVDTLPIPEPFGRIARIVVIVAAVIIMILLLLSLVGEGPTRLPRF